METVLDGKRESDKAKILSDLDKYCKLDTLAMVEIYKRLMKLSTRIYLVFGRVLKSKEHELRYYNQYDYSYDGISRFFFGIFVFDICLSCFFL